jgi:Na+/H+ antiporter NhaC
MIATTLILLLVLIGLSIPVGAALGVLGLILDPLYSMLPLTRGIGELAWSTNNEFLLVAIPLFILLGEILLRSGFAERMYGAMSLWLSWLPGGLMHANIGASALFAATSGSSVATAATVGTVALPQIKRYGYNEPLFLGSLAAGGTLGILIPPSINLVLYGVLTNSSVPKLYLAGIIPGLLLAGLFMLTVIVGCVIKPEWGGRRITASWGERFASLAHLAAAARHLPARGRLDLCGPRHADGGRRARRHRRDAARGLVAPADAVDAARGGRGHDEGDRDDHADHPRRRLPQLRDVGDRITDAITNSIRGLGSRRCRCWS